MKKGNVFCRKTVLLLAFLVQGVMATVAHAVGVGGSGMYQWSVELRGYVSNETGKAPVADADSEYKGAVQPLCIQLPKDIYSKIR